MVSREDIDVIVTALERVGLTDYLGGPDSAGRILWVENLRSLMYRYPADKDGDRPGPIGFKDAEAYEYTHTPVYNDPLAARAIVKSYQYQSCEHPGWQDSLAKEVTDLLMTGANA